MILISALKSNRSRKAAHDLWCCYKVLDRVFESFCYRLQVCYAYSQVAAGFRPSEDGTSPLSPYFKDIVTSLLAAVRSNLHCHITYLTSSMSSTRPFSRTADVDMLMWRRRTGPAAACDCRQRPLRLSTS